MAAATQRGHALAAQRERVVRLRAGRDLQLERLVQRRHVERRAERGERGGHVDDGHEVVAVAHEALVLGDAHEHVQVAGRAALLARVAATGEADPLAVGDPSGHVDRQRQRARPCARARGTRLHGCLGTRPSPSQVSQTVARTTWPNGVRVTARSWPAPPQRSHVSIGVPGSAPLPWQVLAAHDRVVVDLDRARRWRRPQARSSPSTATSPPCAGPARPPPNMSPATAEERVEDVGERAEAARLEAAVAQALGAVAVVGRAALGIGQHLVGLGGLLELRLRLRVVRVDVRMQLAREPAEGLLDLRLVGVARRRRGRS